LCFACFLPVAVFSQTDDLSKKLDDMINEGMKEWQVPGLTTVVIKDGEVVFQKAYGVKNLKSQEAVNNKTLFAMASTTKALVAIAMAMLVEEGKMEWTDKVRDHLPSFRLSDAYITETARVQELLTHNLGIGGANYLWLIDSVSADETFKRFADAPIVYPVRGGFIYQNLNYVAAGQLIESVSGQDWRTFVQENVLDRLEMGRTQTLSANIFKAGNYVTPHYNHLFEGMMEVDYTNMDQIGPAGMIWSCLDDVTNYITFLENDGVYKGDTLLKPASFDYLFKPHALIPGEEYPTQRLVNPNWMSYGLGWFQQDYRGQKLDFHTGSLPGLVALAGLMRDKNVAVYVFGNLDHAELRHAILYKAMDLYAFGDDSRDWHTEVFDLYNGLFDDYKKGIENMVMGRVADTRPSLSLDEYAGEYINKMYGTIVVENKKGALHLSVNDRLHFSVDHWHYDTFFRERVGTSFLLYPDTFDFDIDKSGKVSSMNIFGFEWKKMNE
ncbi:MAG: serine hydrolase, partial [Bacteroidota bacterium]